MRILSPVSEVEGAMPTERQRRWKLGGIGIFFVLVSIAIGASLVFGGSNRRGSSQPKLTPQEIASAPKRLQANLRQANQLLDVPIDQKLNELRGVPVVVNQWASWCPNCRSEFPFFQRLAAEFRDEVAFVGLDSQDDRGAAEGFLKQFPVPYPSVFDPSAAQAVSIGGGRGWPTTIYFNRRGESTYVRPGGYATLAQLRADIERYALPPRV
jgi:thiol-disulfide isomerase/thioredoxin